MVTDKEGVLWLQEMLKRGSAWLDALCSVRVLGIWQGALDILRVAKHGVVSYNLG